MTAELWEKSGSSTGGPSPWPLGCPLVLGGISWAAAPEPRGFPAETPPGLQGREMFYGTGKKKRALPTGPGAAGSSALPCVSAGP